MSGVPQQWSYERKRYGVQKQLTMEARTRLLADIRELREQEPDISISELCRRLAPKYGVTASAVRFYT